jgi:hypothetical protein
MVRRHKSERGCVGALEASQGTEGFSKVFGVVHLNVVNVSSSSGAETTVYMKKDQYMNHSTQSLSSAHFLFLLLVLGLDVGCWVPSHFE